MDVYLVEPTIELKNEYLAFYNDWADFGEKAVPWVVRKEPFDFEEMLGYLRAKENESTCIDDLPNTTYWLVGENKIVIGAVNIRHYITGDWENMGGHIGYGIRPSERRKGYATKILTLALEKAKQFKITNALLTCDKNNIASAKTIINNGGVADSDYVMEDGVVIKRFWIKIED